MSIIAAVHDYVISILNRVPGMKVLLVDSETVGIVSMVLSQSQILEQEVFLVEIVDKTLTENAALESGKAMRHLKAVALLRPSSANFISLAKELKTPRFSEYHLFFTNLVTHNRLEQLAGHDEMELVHQVQEVYADVFAVNRDLFSLNIPCTVSLTVQQSLWTGYEESVLSRMVDGIFAACLSLRMHPFVRYSRSSPLCFKVGQLVQSRIDEEHIVFEQLGQANQSVVLLLDRREDPVTPLLNQWTYQGMCHELIGIDKNRVDLRKAPHVKKEHEEIVMSPVQDKFFEDNLTSNFGDLAMSIEQLLTKFQEQTKSHSKIESIEDMQKFVDSYPEFKKMSGNVTKHVTVVHELSRLVQVNNLIHLSALEQEIACEDSRQDQFRKVSLALSDSANPNLEKLRLVLLYVLRYMQDTQGISQLKQTLLSIGIDESQVQLVDVIQDYAGDAFRAAAGSSEKSAKNMLSMMKKAVGLTGVENVYTQHKSTLHGVVENLIKARLKDTLYPFFEPKRRTLPPAGPGRDKVHDAVVFVVGGTTYEEARDVRSLTANGASCNVVLGGSTIHNSKSFLADVAQLRRVKSAAAAASALAQ